MLIESLGRCLPAEGLSGPVVEGGSDCVEVVLVVAGQVGALGEVLAQQAVGVLVGAALPGAVWIAEVDRHAGTDKLLRVLGHFGSLVPGQRLAQLFGQGRDLGCDRIPYRLGAVAG